MEIDWDEYDFKKDSAVDRYLVEEQLAENPFLFGKYAECYAEAFRESLRSAERIQLKKEELDEVKSTLDAKIRAEWQTMGFAKPPTEASIINWVVLQPEYREALHSLRIAREERIEAQYTETRLKLGVNVMDSRKFTLEKLGELLVKGIYSYSNRPSAAVRELNERSSGERVLDQSKHISTKMKRRKLPRNLNR